MENRYNKVEKFIENQSMDGLRQVARFLLDDDAKKTNQAFVLRCVEEYSRMYPEIEDGADISYSQQKNL